MINSAKALFIAVRIRTLVASIAPVLIGSALSYSYGLFSITIFLYTLLAAIFIQIGTNFANDVYDYLMGADNEDRVGPSRAVQSNLISVKKMKALTIISFSLAILCGLPLVFKGGLPILMIGLLSIISGYLYTAGPYPLGYNGWGDIFVFCFFGPIAVCGTYYLQNDIVSFYSLMMGIVLGSLSTSLLCVNNVRDTDTDRLAGKRTLAVRVSPNFVRMMFSTLLLSSYLISVYVAHSLSISIIFLSIFVLMIYPCIRMIVDIYSLQGSDLNRLLSKVSNYILVYSVVFIFSVVI